MYLSHTPTVEGANRKSQYPRGYYYAYVAAPLSPTSRIAISTGWSAFNSPRWLTCFKNCNPCATIGPILYRKDRW